MSHFFNPDQLSDRHCLHNIRRDMEDDIIFDAFYDHTKGKRNWTAMCLTQPHTADITTISTPVGGRAAVQLRVSGTIDSIIPNPCEYDGILAKMMISLHPIAWSSQPLDNEHSPPSFGQWVKTLFGQGGPAENGKHRALSYDYITKYTNERWDCALNMMTTGGSSFGPGSRSRPLLETPPEIEAACGRRENKESLRLKVGIDDYHAMTGPLKPLLNYIAAGEGNYNSVNRGIGGDTNARNNPQFLPLAYYGYSLTDVVTGDIRKMQKDNNTAYNWTQSDGSVKSRKGIYLAVGRYQIIYQTLKPALAVLKTTTPDIMTKLFNKNMQDALGIYLLFYNRPKVGTYLAGIHDNVYRAAQDLAKEWASIGLQCKWNKHKRGQTAYGGVGGNKASHSPESAVQALQQAKAAIMGNAKIKDVFKEHTAYYMATL